VADFDPSVPSIARVCDYLREQAITVLPRDGQAIASLSCVG
jgi:hypothetical protein